jgi:hypothetical protein
LIPISESAKRHGSFAANIKKNRSKDEKCPLVRRVVEAVEWITVGAMEHVCSWKASVFQVPLITCQCFHRGVVFVGHMTSPLMIDVIPNLHSLGSSMKTTHTQTTF